METQPKSKIIIDSNIKKLFVILHRSRISAGKFSAVIHPVPAVAVVPDLYIKNNVCIQLEIS